MMSTRSKRAARIAAAMPIVARLQEQRRAVDNVWWARHDSREDATVWLVTPISHGTRGEDARADSNYRVAQKCLDEASSFSVPFTWPDWTDADGVTHKGHTDRSGGTSTRDDAWPGGVIETLLVRADDALALAELERIIAALEDYPILNEEDHSGLEYERNHPSDHECYADEDCGCEVRTHTHDEPSGDLDEDGDFWCDYCRTWVAPGSEIDV